jgi:hypothetical protein
MSLSPSLTGEYDFPSVDALLESHQYDMAFDELTSVDDQSEEMPLWVDLLVAVAPAPDKFQTYLRGLGQSRYLSYAVIISLMGRTLLKITEDPRLSETQVLQRTKELIRAGASPFSADAQDYDPHVVELLRQQGGINQQLLNNNQLLVQQLRRLERSPMSVAAQRRFLEVVKYYANLPDYPSTIQARRISFINSAYALIRINPRLAVALANAVDPNEAQNLEHQAMFMG